MVRFAKVSARWLTEQGMTLGITDVTPDAHLNKFKHELISGEFKKCTELVELYKKGELELKTGCDAEQTLESEMSGILNAIRQAAGKFCFNNLPHTNSALKMAICGSKGSDINLC
jgi:DNA-directed RNA polymerase III subunit RPC1